jgi:hypothetical protein
LVSGLRLSSTAIGPFEGAMVKLDLAATCSWRRARSTRERQTSFAQVAADALASDGLGGPSSAVIPRQNRSGVGTFASRSAVTAGA